MNENGSQRSSNGGASSMKFIIIKEWVYSLSPEARKELDKKVTRIKDLRLSSPSQQEAMTEKEKSRSASPGDRSAQRSRSGSILEVRSPSPPRTPNGSRAGGFFKEPVDPVDPKKAMEKVAMNDEFAILATETLNTLFLGLMEEQLIIESLDA